MFCMFRMFCPEQRGVTIMTNKPLEKSIENVLRQAVEDDGGLCLKWTCPGHRGVPDRMVIFPGGIIAFVELKRPGAKVKAGGLQNWWRQRLAEFGFPCYEISTAEQVKQLVFHLSTESFYRMTENSAD
nr:MAG TPA: Nuclease [Caudoviricetes sp.]